jgi:4,5:9,10-diseco-3-hydroxy-5,9,17-trioxoandrosta-1(10),2-diene-4-oate hydrolase
VIGPLASGLRIIVPDIVGYGESDKPKAVYDRPFYAGWLRDFLDALNLDRVSLVGHSQGGAISLQFALESPKRVEQLVLVGSSGLGKVLCLGALIGVLWMNTWPSRAASRWASRYVLHAPAEVDECLIAYRLGVARMAGGRRVFWRGGGRANAPIPPEQLRQVSQPTLLIWGEEERFFPVGHAVSASRVMPNAQVHVISDAGHCPFLEQPEEFSKTVARFMNCHAAR